MKLVLRKYQAYGNDFLLLPADKLSEPDWPRFARAVCDRHFGVGADGCIFVAADGNACSIRIFNCDGSEAGMSGNGSRCAAAFVSQCEKPASPIVLDTRSGRKTFQLVDQEVGSWVFRSRLGCPLFAPGDIPCRATGSEVREYPLEVNGETLRIHALSMGNPQCAVFCRRAPSDEEFRRWGSALEVHPFFPDRTNVSFVTAESPSRLRIKIWERGVGPTLSSGTGSCGAAVAAIRANLAASPVQVATASGSQDVIWEGEEVELIGSVHFVADVHYHWVDPSHLSLATSPE